MQDSLEEKIRVLKSSVKDTEGLDRSIMVDIEKLFTIKINQLEAVKPKWRVLEPYQPCDREQDKVYPAVEDLNYKNYLVAVLDARTDVQYNFKFSDGSVSKIRAERAQETIALPEKDIRKIVLWFNAPDAMLFGIQFFDKEGSVLFQSGYNTGDRASKEYLLEEGERIIGFRASGYSATHAAYYNF